MPDLKQKGKPKISIIGLGRLGTALAVALSNAGYGLETLVTRRPKKGLSYLDAGTPLTVLKKIRHLTPDAVVIIAVPDDTIAKVAAGLATLPFAQSPGTVLHTSGALSSAVLHPLSEVGWNTGSVHPLVSISDGKSGASSLLNAHWCVEGDQQAIRIAKSLVRSLHGKSFSIDAAHKALYHCAAVMSSGNVVALFDIAIEMLRACGLKKAEAQSVLAPLILSAVRNLETQETSQALTGTFSRGDVATVKLHLKALRDSKLKDPPKAYRLLGRRSVEIAAKTGLDKKRVEAILELLS